MSRRDEAEERIGKVKGRNNPVKREGEKDEKE